MTGLIPTDTDIDEAIIAELTDAPDVVAWADIRDRIPGSYWRKVERAVALHFAGRVVAWKCGGATFMELPLTATAGRAA